MTIQLGKASVSPCAPVVAGSYATIFYNYTVEHPIDDTGYIKIVFRYAGDFGTPQFENPGAENYCSVFTTGDCRIEPRWDPKGHTRPWGKSLYLKVMRGFLDEGDTITVVFGDMSEGAPGWRTQTFVEKTFEFKTFADPFATYEFKELTDSPVIEIVPGKPVKAICIAPSQIKVGESFEYCLKLEDEWGNPASTPAIMEHKGFSSHGVKSISAQDPQSGLSAISNPIKVADSLEFLHFWADFHGQTEETIGSNSIRDYYNFAKEYAWLDIAAHQGNDFQITDCFWKTVNELADEFNCDGSFVTFPGYEWSGNTPLGGDRNVYYKSSGEDIFRSSADLLPNNETAFKLAPSADKLFDELKSKDAFIFAHVGGRYANIKMHAPEIETAMEVHSAWGTFEWLVEDALRAGHRIGICANSDGHKCRPGASYPGANKFGSYGGLTCVLAEKLDREHIFEAMKKRHFYATTGNRSVIDLQCIIGKEQAMMGDIIQADGEVLLKACVAGTAPIEKVVIRNGLDAVKTIRPYKESDSGKRIKIAWSGAEARGRDRLSRWDGALKIKGNSIISFEGVNFWNPEKQIEKISERELGWESVTTGGLCGVIVELKERDAGEIEISTANGKLNCLIENIGIQEKALELGGVGKKLAVYRLPEKQKNRRNNIEIEERLTCLKPGDNPIYLRIDQEDGHIAWTSPVYILRKSKQRRIK